MPALPKPLRVKLALLSLGALLVTVACGWLRLRAEPTPTFTCYMVVTPTDTPSPTVTCYAPAVPSPTVTPSPIVTCYEAVLPPPTATPMVTCYKPVEVTPPPSPSATPQSRQMLLDRLLAEGRFPEAVARQLRG